MEVRKFFFDLLYVRDGFAARHPDFFYVCDEFSLCPPSLERVVYLERGRVVTERNEYVVVDSVLFRVPRGGGGKVDSIVSGRAWPVLRRAGKVYYVSVEPTASVYTVYFIDKGRFVYPARVAGLMVTLYLPDGYITTDVENFRLIKSIDEAVEVERIYSYSFVEPGRVRAVMDEVAGVKGAKFFVHPGRGVIWKGAYTVEVLAGGAFIVEPLRAAVCDPVEAVMLPYFVHLAV